MWGSEPPKEIDCPVEVILLAIASSLPTHPCLVVMGPKSCFSLLPTLSSQEGSQRRLWRFWKVGSFWFSVLTSLRPTLGGHLPNPLDGFPHLTEGETLPSYSLATHSYSPEVMEWERELEWGIVWGLASLHCGRLQICQQVPFGYEIVFTFLYLIGSAIR